MKFHNYSIENSTIGLFLNTVYMVILLPISSTFTHSDSLYIAFLLTYLILSIDDLILRKVDETSSCFRSVSEKYVLTSINNSNSQVGLLESGTNVLILTFIILIFYDKTISGLFLCYFIIIFVQFYCYFCTRQKYIKI